MNETILIPGQYPVEEDTVILPDTQYLLKDQYLSEFSTDAEKAAVRQNLEVPSVKDSYTKNEVEDVIINKIAEKITEYSNSLRYLTKEQILEILADYIKNDGSTPFKNPQKGISPQENQDLVTKYYVDKLIQDCLHYEDKENIIREVNTTLNNYTLKNSTYLKNDLYTKREVDSLDKQNVKRDGSIPFTAPQVGIYPQKSNHLTTKSYVDDQIRIHKNANDPHGYLADLEQRLKKYSLKEDVLPSYETYTRTQVQNLIDRVVSEFVKKTLEEHLDEIDPHEIIPKVKSLGYVKNNGETPFTKPQKGVAAKKDNELATLGQVKNYAAVWKTSGPVETTVGFVEDNSLLNEEVTIQEIFDAIFYGKSLSISIPEFAMIGETVKLEACLRGDVAQLDYAQILQNDVVIATLYRDSFIESEKAILDSNIITEDTEFIFRVFYVNGIQNEASASTKISYPIFVGIVPKWKHGNTVSYNYLKDLNVSDPINNKFYSDNLHKIEHQYDFRGSELKQIFIAVPDTFPRLNSIKTPSQSFSADAFGEMLIPFQIPNAKKDVLYRVYLYKESLIQLNIPITILFNEL